MCDSKTGGFPPVYVCMCVYMHVICVVAQLVAFLLFMCVCVYICMQYVL